MAAPRRVESPRSGTAYEADLAAWSLEQAAHLRAGTWDRLDLAHLADEIEALSRTEHHALTSALRVILLHLLKWDHQPQRRTCGWATSIKTQRLSVAERIEDCPSLVPLLPQFLARAYRRARIEAAGETGLDESVFPAACPYPYEAIMTRAIAWPPEPEVS
ncbi:hypothetical protein AFCDBAGC_3428 [Methylobacterium cerastii]|uniref:DUF29 domain-containing protein n=1 Tax=Methylobacterium cerastii TaxID=932741 RepID=A0ABQ4QJX5_9HYPH|nr:MULTISPECIES: DUF29 domain-containing protein [Methylobacterium]TXN03158.1 DUF29 domain-containing protein [Methylobacterium sp. WL122]TXN84809.1 DUF29 domain-containing protein [Methylobacterium sp. WL8]GJD45554.1 hypothetical protein AFCDBAGC_3428 [Methylobacterium cerastii]